MNDGGLLDTVLNNFTSAISGSWGPSLSAYLLPLLLALVCLQFGMIAIEAAISRDIPLLLVHILLGIIRVGIVVAIFQHAFEWGNDITQTFQQLGQNIGGFGPTVAGPSEVFNYGAKIMQVIFHAKAAGSWYNETVQSIEFFITGVVVMACWAVASLIYLGCLIEVALLVYAGPLIICVTPLSWTADLLITWARSLLSIGFKVALILMTLGIGITLATQWKADIAASASTLTTNIWNLLIAIVESAIFAFCVWKVPDRLSGLAPGAAILGFGEAVAGVAANTARNAIGEAAHGGSSRAGSAGGGITSEGWASQGAHATANAAKALAHKVQAKLTS
jgi:P-type conjugative transfer protein TrbL